MIRRVINDLSIMFLSSQVLWPGNLTTIYNLIFMDKDHISVNNQLNII